MPPLNKGGGGVRTMLLKVDICQRVHKAIDFISKNVMFRLIHVAIVL